MPSKRTRKQHSPSIESILRDCYQLSQSERKQLREALDVLIVSSEEEEEDDWEVTIEKKMPSTGARGSRGYIEVKMIKGCGPYAYLRFRSGGTHHSFYLGKVQE